MTRGWDLQCPAKDPHADTNANPTRHFADVWLCLRRVTACRRVLGWAGLSHPVRIVMPRGPWLRTYEKTSGRAAWFVVPVALG